MGGGNTYCEDIQECFVHTLTIHNIHLCNVHRHVHRTSHNIVHWGHHHQLHGWWGQLSATVGYRLHRQGLDAGGATNALPGDLLVGVNFQQHRAGLAIRQQTVELWRHLVLIAHCHTHLRGGWQHSLWGRSHLENKQKVGDYVWPKVTSDRLPDSKRSIAICLVKGCIKLLTWQWQIYHHLTAKGIFWADKEKVYHYVWTEAASNQPSTSIYHHHEEEI